MCVYFFFSKDVFDDLLGVLGGRMSGLDLIIYYLALVILVISIDCYVGLCWEKS